MPYKKEALVIGISLILAAACGGMFLYKSKTVYNNKIKVVGMATKKIESDVAKWNITIARNAGLNNNDMKPAYTLLANDLKNLCTYLETHGIPSKDVQIQPVNVNPSYGNNGVTGYSLEQRVVATSSDVPRIESMALNPSLLFDQGVGMRYSTLEYYYSKLTELKTTLLADATRDAKQRAQAIAQSTGNHIGTILSAQSGVFQVREPYSMDVSDYGIYNTSTKEKEVSVTVNATFEVK